MRDSQRLEEALAEQQLEEERQAGGGGGLVVPKEVPVEGGRYTVSE